MFRPVKDLPICKLNTYESQQFFMLLVLFKIAHDEGLYEEIIGTLYNEYKEIESESEESEIEYFECNMEDIALKILDELYLVQFKYKEDNENGDQYILAIEDTIIGNYYKTVKEYSLKNGMESISEITKEHNLLINDIETINSYCYQVEYIKEKDIITGIEYNFIPEFNMWSDLVFFTYNLMNFYKRTVKKLKNEISEKNKKDVAWK